VGLQPGRGAGYLDSARAALAHYFADVSGIGGSAIRAATPSSSPPASGWPATHGDAGPGIDSRYNSARYNSAHPTVPTPTVLASRDGAHPRQGHLGPERIPLRKREHIRERDAVTHRVTGTDGVSAADLRLTGARCPEHLVSCASGCGIRREDRCEPALDADYRR